VDIWIIRLDSLKDLRLKGVSKMKKTILIASMILLSIFVMGMIQQANSGTYQMVTANTSNGVYIVVIDTRTSLVRIKEVTQCNDQRFFTGPGQVSKWK